MLNPNVKQVNLLEEEYNLYAKHLTLSNIGLNGQKKLKKAKVLIIGAGGLGCPAMLYLAISGIGYIGIIDKDNISTSNLNRQILYNINDLKKKKILCAKEIIQSKNPYCKIILHPYNIITNNALEIIQYYDIIIDACDNFKTRYIIDQYCYQLHKVHIYGAIQEFESQISVFNYKNSIIYSDIYPNNMNLINHNCNYYGVIGIITGHIGILQAAETIKIILGIGNIIYNQLLVFNLLNIKVKNTLIYISKIKKIKKIQYMQKNFIQQNIFIKQPNIFYKNSIILDIRTTNDFKIKHSLCSININLKKFGLKKTIYFLQKKQNKKIMIYCNTTYRSLIISNILDQYKIKYSIIKFN